MSEKQPSRKWSLPEVEKLRDMFFAGKSFKEIAAALNRTSESIKKKAWKLGFHRPRVHERFPDFTPRAPWPRAELNILKDEWEQGATREEISEKIGRSIWAVTKMAQQLGLPSRRTRTKYHHEMQEMFDAGVTANEIGKKYGVTKTTIMTLLNRRSGHNKPDLTDAEREIIEDRYAEGCIGNCIAHRIGRRSAVVCKYIKNVELDRDETDTDGIVAELQKHGLTIRQIGLKLSLPRRSVMAAIKRNERASQ